MPRIGGRSSFWLGCIALSVCVLGAGAPTASASPALCTGTEAAPGTLAGVYPGSVIVQGTCVVDAGPAVVFGALTVSPGATLLATFALNDQTDSGSSSLTVHGRLAVQSGAALIMGCDPESYPCWDDPSQGSPTLSSPGLLYHSLVGSSPLGIVVHDTTIEGAVNENGGGGGLNCTPAGVFAKIGFPVYSNYEDSVVKEGVTIAKLTSCWLGLARMHIGYNLRLLGDHLADPDAIEVLASVIGRNLACSGNSRVWDSAEIYEEALYPRAQEPNEVGGTRSGQCVHSSPTTEGGPLGSEPF